MYAYMCMYIDTDVRVHVYSAMLMIVGVRLIVVLIWCGNSQSMGH